MRCSGIAPALSNCRMSAIWVSSNSSCIAGDRPAKAWAILDSASEISTPAREPSGVAVMIAARPSAGSASRLTSPLRVKAFKVSAMLADVTARCAAISFGRSPNGLFARSPRTCACAALSPEALAADHRSERNTKAMRSNPSRRRTVNGSGLSAFCMILLNRTPNYMSSAIRGILAQALDTAVLRKKRSVANRSVWGGPANLSNPAGSLSSAMASAWSREIDGIRPIRIYGFQGLRLCIS